MTEGFVPDLAVPSLLGGVHEADVDSFDSDRGLGVLRLRSHPASPVRFQCMAISDGSRDVLPGARVAVRIGPAPDGSLEARYLLKLS
ncbi:MAG: hypothetical protein M0Z47_02635 [Actinomycetota bacterium]|nr:hypothetical protein [Actinomycetota bacterium]